MSALRDECRRQFLRFVSGSPLLAYAAYCAGAERAVQGGPPDPGASAQAAGGELIASPADAINVFDFEAVARRNVPPAHFGYMASGIDSEVTLRANREVFSRIQLRPRRMRDVSRVDTGVEVFGARWESPIGLSPVGGQRAYEAGGEETVARAAKARRATQILSTQTSASVEAVTEARGAPVWYQLYATPSWEIARALVKRAEKAGCPVVAVTVDRVGGRNQETFFRMRRSDPRNCKDCHATDIQGSVRSKPMFDGLDVSRLPNLQSANMTWDFVKRLKDTTTMKVVLKGIVTREDAALCLENGVDGIIVSNHGGRGEDNGLSTVDCLPEIVQEVNRRIPVLIDSGFRRGTDVFKALALGATAVCDLGAGAGNVTRLLAARWPQARITGVDASAEMLDRARAELPGIEWVRADLAGWQPPRPVDVLYSNAALHWLSDHEHVFPRLLAAVAPGGVLAVQMPRNFHAPSHTAIADTARSGPWRDRLAELLRPVPVAAPEVYYDILAPRAAAVDIWETEYLHVLGGEDPVKEWTKGSWLKPFLDALEEPERGQFEARYAEAVAAAYPRRGDGRTLLPFRRLFILAHARA